MKEGWEYKKLGEVCDVQNGFAFNSKLFGSEPIGMPLIRIRDIKRGFSETYTSESCGEEFIVSNGDCLIGMDGDFNVGIWKGGTALLNQRVCKLIPSDKVSLKFLYYYIPERLNEINSKTVFTTVKHLSSKQIKEIGVPDISLSEQQRIVSYLDSAFAKIDAVAKNAEASLNEAKALFQSALTKMMEPKEGWEEKHLDELAENFDNRRIPVKLDKRKGGQYPYYGASGIVDYVEDYIFEGNYLLISEDGANLLARATPIAFSVSGKFWVNNHAHILKFNNSFTQQYVEYYFKSINIKEYVTGAAQPKLTQRNLNKIPINIPSINEQQLIVGDLRKLENIIQQLKANLSHTLAECEALKQAILRQTFE